MGARLAASEEQIAIPAHQRVLVGGVQVSQAVVSKNRRARFADGRRSLTAGLNDLIGQRKGLQHRIVEVERRAEEDVELAQPLRPLGEARKVRWRQSVKGDEVRRRA